MPGAVCISTTLAAGFEQTKGVKAEVGGQSSDPGERWWQAGPEQQPWSGQWGELGGWASGTRKKEESEGDPTTLGLSTCNSGQVEKTQGAHLDWKTKLHRETLA